ncbi:tudor and KH domain-containing protein-like [Physella acuta]|uniref:tudor and KH domain-containing protein-like n=1 Tax=Physella acuta TaxID=109671 RepID=UPI0027DC6F35|nr:tudor and KH domain-containing protein-like [Physella acuta]XP_059141184.1 tudor and KH domain-containing protein-like [Physella acuta]XP_059141185.1 tudor and KH domain-containing protein-like [Physella acuta]XP_059141186.1 tudor and KH domain-containing protein-like [Physella acuta]
MFQNSLGKVALALAMPTSILLIYWIYKNRATDDEVYSQHRVVTARNTVIEVLVPQKAVGAVIGRQGSVIKQIQKESGARLHFKDKENENEKKENRTVVIIGNTESAQQAELMIQQIISGIPEMLTEEVEVPSYSLGCLIGKNGVNIRDMTRISGAKILIERAEDFKSPDQPRVVALTGSREQIDMAVELIEEKLQELEEIRAQKNKPEGTNDLANKNTRERTKLKSVPQEKEEWDTSVAALQDSTHPAEPDLPLTICVSAVEHPGHFWVQVVGPKALQLEKLQKEITAFVHTNEAKLNYSMKEVIPGELVASQFEDDSDQTYYRAKVLGETEDGKLDLYFIDFGDNAFVDKKDVYKLRSDFQTFPPQAIECQLANVEPVGGSWSDEAIVYFEEISHCAEWKVLSARVVNYKNDEKGQQRPLLQLFDLNQREKIDIAAELIKRGYAVEVDSTHQATKGI